MSVKIHILFRILALLRGFKVVDLQKIVTDKYGGTITEENLDQFLDEVLKINNGT